MVGVNACVDPNGKLGGFRREGFNAEKTRRRESTWSTKARALREGGFRGLILGTSRVQLGFPANAVKLPYRATYNAGLQAGRMTDIAAAAALAMRHQQLEVVVLGLDFFSFSARETPRDDIDGTEFSDSPRVRVRTDLAGFETFLRSLATVVDNSMGGQEQVQPWGIAKQDPEVAVHARTAFENVLRHGFLVQPGSYAGFARSQAQLDALEATLVALRERGVRTKLFISPLHARQLEVLHQLGLYEDWERWRGDVVEIVERVGGKRVELWDFAGYTAIHTEAIPDGRAPMSWWWESSHYKRATGFAMLKQMYGVRRSREVPVDFGVPLSSQTLDRRHRALREGRDLYARLYPAEVADVARLVRETAPQRSAIPPLPPAS